MRTEDKIKEIESYLNELDGIIPQEFEEYEDNFEKRAACERYFEKIIEAVTDLAFLIIRDKDSKIPEDDKDVFNILSTEKIISKELAERLKEANGMRNIIVHKYGKIDNRLVFSSISEELEKDVEEFIKSIKKEL